MSKTWWLAITLGLCLALVGCRAQDGQTESPGKTFALTDDLGRQVNVPEHPSRVISLSPEATEIIYALGAEKSLIAVVNESDYPPQAKDLPRVGSFSSPSYEGILGMYPDLVIATGHEQASFVGKLASTGVTVVAIYPKDVSVLLLDIKMLGNIYGRTAEAAALVQQIQSRLDEVRRLAANRPRPKVFVEIADQPLMTVAHGSLVDELITIAGGDNIGAGLPRPYCRIEPEQVLAANPDVIILAHGAATPAEVAARPGWQNINAVKNGRVISDIDPSLIFRAGPRIVDGAHALLYAFHPELIVPQESHP
jgi:iron complex transport system substrate-binding protein